MRTGRLRVEVVYALAGVQQIVAVELPAGGTAGQAVDRSGLARLGAGCVLGIAGRRVTRDQVLRDGDRVELLRPLALTPNEARRARARRKKR